MGVDVEWAKADGEKGQHTDEGAKIEAMGRVWLVAVMVMMVVIVV